MTFTYDSTDLSTNLAKVRMAIGDTSSATGEGVKPDGTNFSDEELAVYIDAAATWQAAIPPLLRLLANLYAKAARLVQVGDIREDMSKAAAEYRQQADAWEAALDSSGNAATGALVAGTVTINELYYNVNSDGSVT